MKVMILGGYGVFGGRLARLLAEDGHQVVVVGRRLEKAQGLAQEIGAEALAVDLQDADIEKLIQGCSAQVLIDAVGPFQAYGDAPYRVAEAAIAAGVDYFDLSDDAGFTRGISALDDRAVAASVVVLSGVSSVPALSSAVVADLVKDLADVTLIEAAICPGNKAPRGRSVMAAILAQVGGPLDVWRGGRWTQERAWSGRKMISLGGGLRRPAALIGAPDLALFPKAFAARSVLFRAGLELAVMQRGLEVMSWARSKRLLPDLVKFLGVSHWAAGLLEPFGTARGGMAVEVSGRRSDGRPVTRAWRVQAREGDGPIIPALPGAVAVAKLAKGGLAPGARPAMDVMSRAEAEGALARIRSELDFDERPAPRLFEQALGDRWQGLPAQVRRLHDLWDQETWTGEGKVECATNPLAKFVARVFGFPGTPGKVPVEVTLTRRGESERWERNFGGQCFGSTLGPSRAGHVRERFGPFCFELALTGDADWLGLKASRGWLGPIPLPGWLMPVSEGREWCEESRFHFDVPIALPGVGLIVRYRGWLAPVATEA